MLRFALPICLSIALAACQATPQEPATRGEPSPATAQARGMPANACVSTARIPAVTETDFVEVDGVDGLQPRDRIVEPEQDRLFAVPCPEQMNADVMASLQRALSARGLYGGPITGEWDAATAEAVRRYQAPLGLNSSVLSLDAAQGLGLIAIPRDVF